MEHFFLCPYCNAPISMILEPSRVVQTYVEDCEVCCRPVQITYRLEGDKPAVFSATTLDEV